MSPRRKLIHKSPGSLLNPRRWGLSIEAVEEIPDAFDSFFSGFIDCFATRTWNNWQYAATYLEGLMCMDTKRNYSAIGRAVNGVKDDGQKIQHFMSDSNWDAGKVFARIQEQIKSNPALAGGALVVDASADLKEGEGAGVSRQYIGRIGKVDSCQSCVSIAYVKGDVHALVDAELYLREEWFDEGHRKKWPSLHIPPEREFATGIHVATRLILRAKEAGLPFSVVCCDDAFGYSHDFRRILHENGLKYVADVPSKTLFYLDEPRIGLPEKTRCGKPSHCTKLRPISKSKPLHVRDFVNRNGTEFYRAKVRDSERGALTYEMAFVRGWTVSRDNHILEETLLIRREADGSCSYSLSNAPAGTPYDVLAFWKSQRYFVERTFQDSKSELGWDELVAVKYRSWMHHAALVALGLWFVALMLLQFHQGRASKNQVLSLCRQLKLPRPPPLSVANVRLMFQTILGFNNLTMDECLHVIMKFLINRANSTKCRIQKEQSKKSKNHDEQHGENTEK